MKTILIATDFSQASRQASQYGIQLAKAMNANVILFTAYEVSHPIAATSVQLSRYDVMIEKQQQLADEAAAITNGEKLNLQTVCDEGKAEASILAIAAEKEADLIVVGITGSGNSLRKVFGSTTTSLMKEAVVPVLVVPEKVMYSEPKTILFASDIFLDITIQPIDQIQWITDFFKSKLYVIRVVKDDYEKLLEEVNVPHRLRSELKNKSTTFQFPVNKNISQGLNDFIKTKDINMLVMKPHKHDWIESLFIKSETKDMVFHTRIPILMLPETADKKSEPSAMINAEKMSAL